jgi:phasin family protein
MAGTSNVQDVAAKQAALLQSAYETALKNSMELSEMAKQTQDDVLAQMNERMSDSLDALKKQFAKNAE